MMDTLKSMQDEIKFLKANNKNNSNNSNNPKITSDNSNNTKNSNNSEDGGGSKKKKKWREIPRTVYCWKHGYCWHTDEQCFVKRDRHQNSATLTNKKRASTSNYPDI